MAAIDPLIDSKVVDLSFSGSLKETTKSLTNVLKSLMKMRGDIGSFYNLMTSPASKLLDQFFESEPLKVTNKGIHRKLRIAGKIWPGKLA